MSERTCSIPDCQRTHYGRGWCRLHWWRATNNGNPLVIRATPKGAPLAYLAEHRHERPEGCKEWPFGHTKDGYPIAYANGGNFYLHQLACSDKWGPAPMAGMDAAHGPCHNRGCWNADHLSWKTRSENLADKVRDGTSSRGEGAARHKLTSRAVLEIRARADGTASYPLLAAEFGVSRHLVSLIVRRKRWTHI